MDNKVHPLLKPAITYIPGSTYMLVCEDDIMRAAMLCQAAAWAAENGLLVINCSNRLCEEAQRNLVRCSYLDISRGQLCMTAKQHEQWAQVRYDVFRRMMPLYVARGKGKYSSDMRTAMETVYKEQGAYPDIIFIDDLLNNLVNTAADYKQRMQLANEELEKVKAALPHHVQLVFGMPARPAMDPAVPADHSHEFRLLTEKVDGTISMSCMKNGCRTRPEQVFSYIQNQGDTADSADNKLTWPVKWVESQPSFKVPT